MMTSPDVRIIKLEPMRVAAFYGFSKTPEDDAHKQCIVWLKEMDLYDHPDSYRSFGFNNPDPTPGSPNYGYEIWIPIDTNKDVGENVKTKDFVKASARSAKIGKGLLPGEKPANTNPDHIKA
jgi:hypothetical protein